MSQIIPEISRLMEKLRITSDKIEEITTAITNCTDDTDRDGLTDELNTLQATEKDTKSLLFDEWNKNMTNINHVTDPPAQTVATPSPSTSSSTPPNNVKTGHVRATTSSTLLTARMTAPKQYTYGDNFTTWSSRIKRYFRTTQIRPDQAIELLLNSVDDRTLEKLEPVADKLTDKQRSDPDLFMPIFEQAMYPKSEIRALRQQLNSGQLVQEEEEDVDTFASRIRSLAKRAYSDPSDRQEPCLNTFLCGIKDVTLYDKVICVPGAEDCFELAVESARKFETMRRTTRSRTPEQLDVLRTYKLDATNRDHDTQPDTTPAYRRTHPGQPESRYDNNGISNTDSAYNGQSYLQYQPRRGNNSYRGPYRGNNRRDTRTCHLCEQQGHFVRSCPQLPAALNFLRAGNSNAGPSTQ